MADKPVTREEKYLAYLTGDYTGEVPKPITRKEKYLYELCLKGMGGEISPEEIKNAVNEYLEKNPVKPGATTEQAQQIEQNKTDIASLKTETGSLKEDISNKITKFYASNQGETHITDSDNGKIQDMMLYGKSSQDGTPTPENPVEIKSVVNPTVKVTNEDGLKVQFVTLNNITLNAIPVSSGGNVTINGQQYIADYVDVERGKLVKKLKSFTVSDIKGISTWGVNKNADNITGFYFYIRTSGLPKSDNEVMTSTILRYADDVWGGRKVGCSVSWNTLDSYIILSVPTNMLEDSSSDENACASFVKICENTNAIFFYSMASSIETDLAPEEIQAFKALTTYYPVTNINISSEQLDGYTVFNYPTSFEDEWNKTQKEIGGLKEDLTSKADKTSLAQTDRKLDALWKLNQGISYEFQTDEAEAYQKTVPSGAKMVSIKSIGGKTIVRNQMISDGVGELMSAPVNEVIYLDTKNQETSYPIPQAILNLTGYGWSAGNVRNEVDWENKQYIQRVGKYTIDGSEIISKENTYWVMTVTDFEKPRPSTQNAICVNFKASNKLSGKWGDIFFRSGGNGFVFTDSESKFANKNEVKDYFQQNNETIYYELNEEQIIDISDIIDNTFQEPLEVEAGGTLTFKNSHGDDYRIPVPSTEEYLVSLAEVAK